MLRSSKNITNRPFTCAFCAIRPCPSTLALSQPQRHLHSSNKANEYEVPPATRSSEPSYSPAGFDSVRHKKTAESAAAKWGIPEPRSNPSSNPSAWRPRNGGATQNNASPGSRLNISRVGTHGNGGGGGSNWKAQPASASAVTGPPGRDPVSFLLKNSNINRAGSLPGLGNDSQRSSGGIMSRITGDTEGFAPRYAGRNDQMPRPQRDSRYGGERTGGGNVTRNAGGDTYGQRFTRGDQTQQSPRGNWQQRGDRFGGEQAINRHGDDRQGMGARHGGERNSRPAYSEDRQQRNERFGGETRSGKSDGGNLWHEPAEEVEAPTPSRYTTGQAREKPQDASYTKKQAAKAKDRGRNRRFDDTESAILDEAELSGKEAKKAKKAKRKEARKELIPIFLPQFISIETLAAMLNIRVERFTQQLQDMGFTETSYGHVLGAEEAGLICGEYGYDPVIDRGNDLDLKPRPPPEDKTSLPTRPPVVTIMGHVDHGKTTLLDWLRKSAIVDSEHGGITQHIGAFSVTMPSGKVITFLDTPGHAAFLSMRERGANVTDIVILVVAADDSVKPQTIEAIRHAKAANVPMIVAINKVDKEGSDVERVKQDLARYGVEVEDYGGDTQTVCVSGKTGQGMEDLEEATLLLGEILDHRAETDGQTEGWVLEATTKKKGRVATVLITRGSLKPGDILVAGKTWTKVRSMTNEFGDEVLLATPGTPVEIDGWRDHPEAGELALSAETEDRAKQAVDYRIQKADRIKQATDMEAINESRRLAREKEEAEEEIRRDAISRGEDPEKAILEAAKKIREGAVAKTQEIGLIVKADVAGSVEAVVDSVSALGNNEVKTRVIRSSFGAVSEFDIDHAAAAGAYVLAFNLPADPQITQYARARKVTIISHNVIYHLVDEVRHKLSELLPPKISTNVTGEAEVAQIFQINIKGSVYKPVAGCRVKLGVVARNSKVRVIRKKEVVYDGTLDSLKNVKKDVPEMRKGSDCGLGFEGWGEFQEGDLVQCYEVIEEKRYL